VRAGNESWQRKLATKAGNEAEDPPAQPTERIPIGQREKKKTPGCFTQPGEW